MNFQAQNIQCLPPVFHAAKSICLLAPHQDDEALGAGGLLACLAATTDVQITVIFMTDGSRGIKHSLPPITKHIRHSEALKAQKLLGDSVRYEFLDFPDGQLANKTNILEKLNRTDRQFDILLLPNNADWHPDHVATHNLGREFAQIQNINNILVYEVWSPLQNPDVLCNITDYVQHKRDLIQCYKSQIAQVDFEVAIVGLNAYRAMSLPKQNKYPNKTNYAEAFLTVGH